MSSFGELVAHSKGCIPYGPVSEASRSLYYGLYDPGKASSGGAGAPVFTTERREIVHHQRAVKRPRPVVGAGPFGARSVELSGTHTGSERDPLGRGDHRVQQTREGGQ